MKNTKSGFTLPELLIVVAIIAVLVAIAIPVFSAQLESSRQASDISNIRAAYAEATADALTQGGKDGVAETGIMKHTGVFDKLGEATIGNLDLKTSDADPVVKDYSVIVTVSAKDGSVSLGVGNGGHLLGTTASDADIAKIKSENPYYPGRNVYPFEKFWAVGSTLNYYHQSYAGLVPIPDATGHREAEYGVPMTLMVNDDHGTDRKYFIWDGASWYMVSGKGEEWQRVNSRP